MEVIYQKCLTKVNKLAEGAYGVIYSANFNGYNVAVKRFKSDIQKNFIGCIRELDFLIKLRGHPFVLNILAISKGCPFMEGEQPLKGNYIDDKLYLIIEKAAYNATSLIGTTDFKIIKKIMVQSLLGLEYIHANGIIHRDIKPDNLLWVRDGDNRYIKFCDFGLSKIYTLQEPNSCEVFTPIYRPPEAILNFDMYDQKSDVWSLGVIFYEFLKNKPLLDIKNYTNTNAGNRRLLIEIFRVIPELPDTNYLTEITNKVPFKIPEICPKKKGKKMENKIKDWDELLDLFPDKREEFGNYNELKDLLSKMLEINHYKRWSCTQLLQHRFFNDYKQDINCVREKYPIINKEIKVHIINCDERKWGIQIGYYLYNHQSDVDQNGKKIYSWYQDRIIFHAIEIYDRYLIHYHNNNSYKITKQTAEFCFMVCVYICIKYFLTILEPCTFKALIDSKFQDNFHIKIAEDFEWMLLSEILKFNVYNPTVYEIADEFNIKLTKQQVNNLLYSYGESENIELPLKEFFKLIIKK